MSDVTVRPLPPERGRPSSVVVYAGGCCCCCCCLHSLGGLVGSASALASRHSALPAGAAPPHVGVVYWLCLQLACVAVFLVPGVEAEAGVVGLAFLLPVLQLAATVLALIWIACTRPANAGLYYRRLLKVASWGILGTLAGGAVLALGAYVVCIH